jgi:queuosine precursor transporter
MKKTKTSMLQTALTVLYVAALMISNVVTSRQIQLPFGLTMTGGTIVFPITYILSDVFSECYGYKWSRITCNLAFAMNALMSIIFAIVIACPAPAWFANAEAYTTVLSSAPRILIASFIAFWVGDWANDKVFQKMKRGNESIKGFGGRAILSSLVGEIVDSAIFNPLAFIGTMTIPAMLSMMVLQVVLKIAYEIIILPVTTLVAKKVGAYEKK